MSISACEARGFLESTELQGLFDALAAQGYRILGPVARDGAIVYDDVRATAELPVGWTDEQSPGQYRLKKRGDNSLFGYNLGPQSWKKFLYPSSCTVWRATLAARSLSRERSLRGGGGLGWGSQYALQPEPSEKLAFIGARACELQAIAIQDRVLLHGIYADSAYAALRANLFIVAVQCAQAGDTCFCASMQAGPKATAGYDLALTEVLEDGRHYFVVDTGTPRGAHLLQAIPHRDASPAEAASAERVIANTARQMTRSLPMDGVKELLYREADSPRWETIAQRCLACANCTLVCPTCFCAAYEDVPDLSGTQTERRRRWDSCFNAAFAYMHGGSARASLGARYRQWLTHKMAAWIDQFGTVGCVGCGRCITWCPAGIDITDEVRGFQTNTKEVRSDAAN